ncbi:MAG: archease [Gemmatimonadetes bacterium]|nr:archease [Gemmatimonadota bacterium]
MGADSVPPGVLFLDHTADVGLDLTASTLAQLFTRAALGMGCLISGGERAGVARRVAPSEPPGAEPLSDRRVSLSADDLAALLREWLRELLHWHEVEGLALRAATFDVLTERRLEAVVTLAPAAFEPVREIKGVTLHGLRAERRGGRWAGRVIFDV